MHMPLAGAVFSFDLCTHMMPNTVVTDFGNRGGQCQGGRLLYLVKLLYVILHFQSVTMVLTTYASSVLGSVHCEACSLVRLC